MMEKKITNKKVRYRLHNNGNIDFLNAKRRLTFLGRWVRMPCKNIPARFWSSRSTDYIVRYSMIIDIRKIIPKKNENRFFNSWVYITNDEIIWSILINNMIEKHSNHDFKEKYPSIHPVWGETPNCRYVSSYFRFLWRRAFITKDINLVTTFNRFILL